MPCCVRLCRSASLGGAVLCGATASFAMPRCSAVTEPTRLAQTAPTAERDAARHGAACHSTAQHSTARRLGLHHHPLAKWRCSGAVPVWCAAVAMPGVGGCRVCMPLTRLLPWSLLSRWQARPGWPAKSESTVNSHTRRRLLATCRHAKCGKGGGRGRRVGRRACQVWACQVSGVVPGVSGVECSACQACRACWCVGGVGWRAVWQVCRVLRVGCRVHRLSGVAPRVSDVSGAGCQACWVCPVCQMSGIGRVSGVLGQGRGRSGPLAMTLLQGWSNSETCETCETHFARAVSAMPCRALLQRCMPCCVVLKRRPCCSVVARRRAVPAVPAVPCSAVWGSATRGRAAASCWQEPT